MVLGTLKFEGHCFRIELASASSAENEVRNSIIDLLTIVAEANRIELVKV